LKNKNCYSRNRLVLALVGFNMRQHRLLTRQKNRVFSELKMERNSEKRDRTAQTMSDTIVDVLDKLAGTKSEIKLSFQDLTLDTGVIKAKMTGAVVLQTILAQDTENKTSKMNEKATVYSTSG
jgi:hypothetical protein